VQGAYLSRSPPSRSSSTSGGPPPKGAGPPKGSASPSKQSSSKQQSRPPPRYRDGLTLEWVKIRCEVKTRSETRSILSDVTGRASPGRLLAVMGPSGSGKTTLLDCLASHVQQSNNLLLEGEIFVNGEICNQNMGNIRKGYVRQEDIFYSQMTVRETLRFVARLKLPREVTYEEKMSVVEKLIKRLSLSKCADTLVGDGTVGRQRGISGGEKKRLSIACELIGDPKLLFLDEPTTGLDSFQVKIRPLLDCMGAEILMHAWLL
jgi:ABC-type multidrug transport system ATPase subunit